MHLVGIGEKVSETEKISVLLNGLPDEYNSQLVDSLSTQSASYETMCNLLRDREERTTNKIKLHEKNDTIAYIKQNKFNKFNNKPNLAKTMKIHLKTEEYNRTNTSSNFARRRLCFTCKQPGHMAFFCPRNKDKPKCRHTQQQCGYQQSSTNDSSMMVNDEKTQQGNTNEEEQLFLAAEKTNRNKSNCWYIDSAATRHITNNKNILVNEQKLEQPILATCANNEKLQMDTIGEVNLSSNEKKISLSNVALSPNCAASITCE